MRILFILSLLAGCGSSQVVASSSEKTELREPPEKAEKAPFKPLPHPFFKTLPVSSEPSIPTTEFSSLAKDYAGKTIAWVDISSGAELRFGENRVRSCEIRRVPVIGSKAGDPQLYVHSADFAWYPSIKTDQLADLLLEDTLVYHETGLAFAKMAAGSRPKVQQKISEKWDRVCVVEDCSVEGIIETGRTAKIVVESETELWDRGLEDVPVLDKPFRLLNADGEEIAKSLRADRFYVISKSDELVEVAFDRSSSVPRGNRVTFHGFVSRALFDALLDDELSGISGWSQSGSGREFEKPVGFLGPGSWIYGSENESTPFGQPIRDARVSILETDEAWSKIAVETSWGRLEGFAKQEEISTTKPDQPTSFAVRGIMIPNDCSAD